MLEFPILKYNKPKETQCPKPYEPEVRHDPGRKNIGAQYIISGYLIDLGTTYRFGVYAINMQDAVRVAQSSVNLSAYDEQISFLLTGSTTRPSLRTIPQHLSEASSFAAFLQSASIMAGNTIINRIPRNARIAIIMPGDYVESDYIRNELDYILRNSSRFQMIPFQDIDLFLSEHVGFRIEEEYHEIGRRLGADYIIWSTIMIYEDDPNVHGVSRGCQIMLYVVHVNSQQRISTSFAWWSWPDGEELFFEQ